MNIREFVVEIEQVLVSCTVAHDSRGENFLFGTDGVIDGIIESECQSAIGIGNAACLVDIINSENAPEVFKHARNEGGRHDAQKAEVNRPRQDRVRWV